MRAVNRIVGERFAFRGHNISISIQSKASNTEAKIVYNFKGEYKANIQILVRSLYMGSAVNVGGGPGRRIDPAQKGEGKGPGLPSVKAESRTRLLLTGSLLAHAVHGKEAFAVPLRIAAGRVAGSISFAGYCNFMIHIRI